MPKFLLHGWMLLKVVHPNSTLEMNTFCTFQVTILRVKPSLLLASEQISLAAVSHENRDFAVSRLLEPTSTRMPAESSRAAGSFCEAPECRFHFGVVNSGVQVQTEAG